MIKCIIFDLDDTLCDYKAAMENAKLLLNLELEKQSGIDVQKFWHKYHDIEPGLFRQFTTKAITLEEYRIRRYSDVLANLKINSNDVAYKLNEIYINAANVVINLFEDTIPIVNHLKEQGIKVVILSNGPRDGQQLKFQSLGLQNIIDKFYISEVIGFSKPSKESFNHVLSDNNISADEAVMIGDSIEYDINGATQAGIHAVLLDRNGKHGDFGGVRVTDLYGLIDILENKFGFTKPQFSR